MAACLSPEASSLGQREMVDRFDARRFISNSTRAEEMTKAGAAPPAFVVRLMGLRL
jgi:hypothetical protein